MKVTFIMKHTFFSTVPLLKYPDHCTLIQIETVSLRKQKKVKILQISKSLAIFILLFMVYPKTSFIELQKYSDRNCESSKSRFLQKCPFLSIKLVINCHLDPKSCTWLQFISHFPNPLYGKLISDVQISLFKPVQNFVA